MSDLLKPGQLFARRYRIERFLAKGGFGAVYAAEQAETELKVALKVLWPHVLHSQDAVEKFKLEARVAGRVGSEHIVKVFDAGFDDATEMPFLCMELLDGEHLERVVKSGGPLSPGHVVTYFRQVCSALDRAHGYVDKDGAPKPIVHRDLKPENLFLANRESGGPIVKVLDFGIAKVLSNSMSVSHEVKGTPLYMAFEQASADRITPQTDIWALGLIAFFLLTGRCYWKTANLPEPSLTQLFGEVLATNIDPPSRRAAELGSPVALSPAFDAWFARCVNRDVSQRFATAGECAAALGAVFSGAPGIRVGGGAARATAFAATEDVSGEAWRQAVATGAQRYRDESGVGIGATGGPLILGQTDTPLPRSSSRGMLGFALAGVLAVGGGATFVALRSSPEVSPVVSSAVASPAMSTGMTATAAPAPLPPPTASAVAEPAEVVAPVPSAGAPSPADTKSPPAVEANRSEKRASKHVATATQPAEAQPVRHRPTASEAKPARVPTSDELYEER
jgi:eukaryotic-like serine/threonine-protein kinase